MNKRISCIFQIILWVACACVRLCLVYVYRVLTIGVSVRARNLKFMSEPPQNWSE